MIEQWSKDFFAFCDAFARDWEAFVQELEEFSNEFTQSVEQALEELEQAETTLTEEFELFWEELLDPLWDDEWVSESDFTSDLGMSSKVEPDETTHPACVGCRHYHGYVYGGNLLVCAMHPYGWYDENCPDWEAQESEQ